MKKKINYYYINTKNNYSANLYAILEFVDSYPDNVDIGITSGIKKQFALQQSTLKECFAQKSITFFSYHKKIEFSWNTVILSIENSTREKVLPIIRSALKSTNQNLILLCDYTYWKDKTNYFKTAKEIIIDKKKTYPILSSNKSEPVSIKKVPRKNFYSLYLFLNLIKQKRWKKLSNIIGNLIQKFIAFAFIVICVIALVIDVYTVTSDGIEKILHPDQVVEITTNGIRYHTPRCPTIADLPKRSVSLKKAKKLNRTPCKVCQPIGYNN